MSTRHFIFIIVFHYACSVTPISPVSSVKLITPHHSSHSINLANLEEDMVTRKILASSSSILHQNKTYIPRVNHQSIFDLSWFRPQNIRSKASLFSSHFYPISSTPFNSYGQIIPIISSPQPIEDHKNINHTKKIQTINQESPSPPTCSKPYYTWIPLILSMGTLVVGTTMSYYTRQCQITNAEGQCISDKTSDSLWLNMIVLGSVTSVISYAHHRTQWQQNCLYQTL